ncbi:MAG TPA: ABC transporter substrate-binding protein [Acidimicrobiales bacterium]|nr:ABC transporter substrate-binding protein [Acidimicrobiales bacterium]
MTEQLRRYRLRRAQTGGDTGFTLIELLVVVVILGILSAVVVFAVNGIGDKGNSAAIRTDAAIIRTAEEAYCGKFGKYAPDQATLQSAGLLAPGNGNLTTIETAGVTGPCTGDPAGPSGYRLSCTVTSSNSCAGAPTTEIVRGGTLVVAQTPTGPWNPANSSSGTTHPTSEAMFNGLLAFDANNNVVPDLAAALPTVVNNGDGTQDVSFTLRSGMVWQDSGQVVGKYQASELAGVNPTGAVQPITNDDVIFSFAQAILRYQGRTAGSMNPPLGASGSGTTLTLPGSNCSGAGDCSNLGGTAITGFLVGGQPLGVKFHFLYPYSPLSLQMNVTEAAIIPKHVYDHCAVHTGTTDPLNNADPFKGTLGSTSPVTAPTAGYTCAENLASVLAQTGTVAGPIGSGPFMWNTGSLNTTTNVLTLNKNPQYFKAGLPYLNKLVFQPTANTKNSLLVPRGTSGSVDLGSIGTPSDLATFANASYNTYDVPRGTGGSNCVNTIGFNLWQPTGVLPEWNFVGNTTGGHAPGGFTPNSNPLSGGPNTVGDSADGLNPAGSASIGGFTADTPYDNPIVGVYLVRKALFEGFDRTGAFNAVDQGVGRVADSIYNSNDVGAYSPAAFPAYSVAQANADLDAAGWTGTRVTAPDGTTNIRTSAGVAGLPDGTPLLLGVFHNNVNPAGTGTDAYTARFKSDMAAIGVDIVNRNGVANNPATPTNSPTYAASSTNNAGSATRNFEMSLVSYCNGDDPVIGVQRSYVSSQIANSFLSNLAGYRESSMDALWLAANQATTPAARTAAYTAIQNAVVARLPYIWINESLSKRIVRSVCQGVNNYNTGLFAESAYCPS